MRCVQISAAAGNLELGLGAGVVWLRRCHRRWRVRQVSRGSVTIPEWAPEGWSVEFSPGSGACLGCVFFSSIQTTWKCPSLRVLTLTKKQENFLVRVFMGTLGVWEDHKLCASALSLSDSCWRTLFTGKSQSKPNPTIGSVVSRGRRTVFLFNCGWKFWGQMWSRKITWSQLSGCSEQITTPSSVTSIFKGVLYWSIELF